jgi:hypothetical protein
LLISLIPTLAYGTPLFREHFRRPLSIRAIGVRIEGENRHGAGSHIRGIVMKQYLLSIIQPDGLDPKGNPPPPEVLQEIMRDVAAVRAEMKSAGVWVFSGGLHAPSTATVVRPSGGHLSTTDGPFVESKEHVGGITIIRARDLDAALAWAGKLATAIMSLPIEVRPFQDEPACD